eukprot:6454044-Amphidinium_carterae.1
MQKQQSATPRTLDDEEMPPPSVKGPKEMEEDRKARFTAARARFDQSQPSSARGSNEPLLPVAESSWRSRPPSRTPSTAQSRANSVSAHTPRSHASSEARSVAPSVAPTINYDTLLTNSMSKTQSDVVLSYLSIMVDQVPPSFGRVTDETLLLLLLSSSSPSGDVESSLAAKATNSSTIKSKRGRLEASTQQLRDHSEAFAKAKRLEIQSWLDNDAYELVDLRKERVKNYVTGRWALTVRKDKDGNFKRARHAGSCEVFKINRRITFKRTHLRPRGLVYSLFARLLLLARGVLVMSLTHVDLKTAFLQGE